MATPTEQFDIDDVQLRDAHAFLDQVLIIHRSKAAKQSDLSSVSFGKLNLFAGRNITRDDHRFSSDGVESVRLKLPNNVRTDAFICFQELKNEIGEGGSDPIAQAECDYQAAYSHARVRNAPSSHHDFN